MSGHLLMLPPLVAASVAGGTGGGFLADGWQLVTVACGVECLGRGLVQEKMNKEGETRRDGDEGRLKMVGEFKLRGSRMQSSYGDCPHPAVL